jgi:hypothetical protein
MQLFAFLKRLSYINKLNNRRHNNAEHLADITYNS